MIEFILSSFWTWLGFIIATLCLCYGIVDIIKAIHPTRKVRITYYDDRHTHTVEIINAAPKDVDKALTEKATYGDFSRKFFEKPLDKTLI